MEARSRRSSGDARGKPPWTRGFLNRPGRAARKQHLESKIDEFCALDFDDVGVTQRSGMVCRMMAILKTLAQSITYWVGG